MEHDSVRSVIPYDTQEQRTAMPFFLRAKRRLFSRTFRPYEAATPTFLSVSSTRHLVEIIPRLYTPHTYTRRAHSRRSAFSPRHPADVSITHLTFGKEFTSAVEAKQVAQQESERAKFIVMRAEQEKLAAVIDAEGQSEAATLITKAMKEHGTGMLEVRRIDAAREIAHTLARSRNVCYLPGNNNMLLNLPG